MSAQIHGEMQSPAVTITVMDGPIAVVSRAYLPACRVCGIAYRDRMRLAPGVPVRVNVGQCLVIRIDDELLIISRCHGSASTMRLPASRIRDERDLESLVAFRE